MNPVPLKKEQAVKKEVLLPFITIALPFDPGSTSKDLLERRLKLAQETVEKEASQGIPFYMVEPAMAKLRSIISNLNYSPDKKSVIIFLSPFQEKVFYLKSTIKERVIVGEPLNIVDLIHDADEERKYLVLAIREKNSVIYHGEGEKLSVIIYNSFKHTELLNTKETYLKHIDSVLHQILNVYSMPVIAVGSEGILEQFRALSKCNDLITDRKIYNGEANDRAAVATAVSTVIQHWGSLKVNFLLKKIEKALMLQQAELGIDKVWKAAKNKRGRFLIAEKAIPKHKFVTTSYDGSSEANYIIANDSLTEAIEKVLSLGGQVEFVDADVLKDYNHVVLLTK